MASNFKFFNQILFKGHDGWDIRVGQTYYTVAKQNIIGFGSSTLKYTIKELVATENFLPLPEYYWYFGSKSNAEYLIDIWKRQDKDGI